MNDTRCIKKYIACLRYGVVEAGRFSPFQSHHLLYIFRRETICQLSHQILSHFSGHSHLSSRLLPFYHLSGSFPLRSPIIERKFEETVF